ncbi:glycoside hydrolase family 20 protein [Sphaerobolus stellatus SS14]|nr:glycoside hydrolase family 20 protein [Sphaerobolus stellatus SS14]
MLPLLWLSLACVIQTVAGLWPMPGNLAMGSTALRLSPSFSIAVNVKNPPSDLMDAVSRTTSALFNDKLQRLVVGRGVNDTARIQAAKVLSQLKLSIVGSRAVQSISAEATAPFETRSESYSLTVPADGSAASITAASTLGLLRGLTTFGQLWYQLGTTTYSVQAPVTIKNDAPAYPYRGFMLDTARNFFTVDDIKRTLDAMSMVKLNSFHWHSTDTQSWPLEVDAFPELSAKGAYSTDQSFSKANIQDIISYAGARGIDVVLEIDTPGHTGSISFSHPELVACSVASPWANFASEPPSGQLRMTSPQAMQFAASIFSSVSSVFPSKYISTGGDEINTACYMSDNQTQADLKASGQTLEQALNTFTQATHGALKKAGKTPIVWEEMILDHQVDLSNDTIAMVWISSQNVASVVQKGFRVIHTASDFLYLDCGAGEWIGADIDNSWCDPFKTWQKIYSFDPLANLTSSQQKLILGGETLLWTEQSDSSNLDPIAWPRTAAAAEVFWTGPTLPGGTPASGREALPRLHDIRYRMVQRGIKAIALQPQWCALRPGLCNIDS